MKTIKLLGYAFFTMLLSVSFSACGGDDDNNKSSSNPLVGTWRAEVISKDVLRYWDLTFTSDYKFTAKDTYAETGEVKETTTGTYSVENGFVTINADGFGTSAFQINGNELTFAEWDHGIVYKKIN